MSLTRPERTDLANQLQTAGWPAVAEDIAAGADPATVIEGLNRIGEENSDAVEILLQFNFAR